MSADRLQGGVMGGVEDLYREVILEHFKSPKNRGRLDAANARAEGLNPLCGDQITVSAVVDGGTIKDIRFEGHGCAISQSSASMMTAAVKGRRLESAAALTATFKALFGVEADPAPAKPEDLGDLEALEGVKRYPVRIKCALLSWNTLLEALKNANTKQGERP